MKRYAYIPTPFSYPSFFEGLKTWALNCIAWGNMAWNLTMHLGVTKSLLRELHTAQHPYNLISNPKIISLDKYDTGCKITASIDGWVGAFYARYNGNMGRPKNKKSCFFHYIFLISNKCRSFVPWHSNLFSKLRSRCNMQIFKVCLCKFNT